VFPELSKNGLAVLIEITDNQLYVGYFKLSLGQNHLKIQTINNNLKS